MKKHTIYILILLVGLFSCSKSNSNNSNGVLTATVNGTTWKAISTNISFNKVPNLQITIHADSNNTNFNLNLSKFIGIDTYKISPINSAYYTEYSLSTGNSIQNADSGAVIITKSSAENESQTRIEGTFYFNSGTLKVSNGTFNVLLNLN